MEALSVSYRNTLGIMCVCEFPLDPTRGIRGYCGNFAPYILEQGDCTSWMDKHFNVPVTPGFICQFHYDMIESGVPVIGDSNLEDFMQRQTIKLTKKGVL